MRELIVLFWLSLLFVDGAAAVGNRDGSATVGPEKGWLIIQGGGAVSEETKKRFVALAGGPDASFVLIPTPMSDEEMTAGGFFQGQGRGWAKSMGINHVTMLHTRDRTRANTEYFIDALRKASGVWIMGGRQWRLADAYLDTAVEREIKELLVSWVEVLLARRFKVRT